MAWRCITAGGAAVAAAVLVACTGSSGEDALPSTTTRAPDPICDAHDELEGLEVVLSSPAIFDATVAEVEAQLDRRRALEAEIEALTDDEVMRSGLEDLVAAREVIDPVILEQLTEDRDGAEALGYFWQYVVFDSDLVTPEQNAAHVKTRDNPAYSRLAARCAAPALAEPPEEDLTGAAEAGTIVFDRIGPDGQGGLWAVPSTGGDPVALPPPDGWDDLTYPTVAPDGSRIAAIATHADAEPHEAVAVGTLGGGFEILAVPGEAPPLSCPRWDGRRDRVLVTSTPFAASQRPAGRGGRGGGGHRAASHGHLLLRRPRGRRPAGHGARVDIRDSGDVVVVDADGTDLEPLFGIESCHELIGEVDQDAQDVLVFQSCDDPRFSGLYVVHLASGNGAQIVAGLVGVPAWSPSGDWIAYGYVPLGENGAEETRVWVARRDGTGARMVTETGTSFPAWVKDEL